MRQRTLLRGGHIAVVAPSGTIAPEFLEEGISQIEKAGFSVEVMPHVVGHTQGVFSASDEERAADLMEALTREDVDVVWCTRGGYGAVRTLQSMDLSTFSQTDKVIVGFSDITALHSVAVAAGGVGLLAPMLKHIAIHGVESEDVANTLALLRGERVEIRCQAGEGSREGRVRAKIVGGNLSILYSLRATPADVCTDGAILFIEDLCEYRYHIDRMMQNLRFSGVLSRLSGIVVGQMTGMKDGATAFGRNAYEIVSDAVADYDYPVLMGFPSGHDPEVNQPILLGAEAELIVENGEGRIVMGR